MIKNFCIEDPIINMIQPGDYFKFVKNIGGADERMLRIRDFTVHTRGLFHRPKTIECGRNINSLTKHNREHKVIETTQIRGGSLKNVVTMFEKQDRKSQIHNNRKKVHSKEHIVR